MKASTEEILLAALARSLARTIGEGVAGVDLSGAGRSVLRPDVDFHRTMGWFSTVYPIPLPCMGAQGASAAQLLEEVARTVKAVPHHGIGYGLLRYLHAPTAGLLGGAGARRSTLTYPGCFPNGRRATRRSSSTPTASSRSPPPCPVWAIRWSCGPTGMAVFCTWTGGTTLGGCLRVRSRPSHKNSRHLGRVDRRGVRGDGDSADSDAEDEAMALVDLSAAVFDDDE